MSSPLNREMTEVVGVVPTLMVVVRTVLGTVVVLVLV
jgi:hypothetical protein